MWPWEHVAFGYLLYSAGRHLSGRGGPDWTATLAVAFGALLPDLIDKPLSWSLGVFSTSYAVGHAIVVAPFVWVAVVLAARRAGNVAAGVAFAVGYASHLVGDIIYPLVRGQPPAFHAVLWPFVTVPSAGVSAGLLHEFWRYFSVYAAHLLALDFGPVMLFTTGLALVVFALWAYDGLPVLAELGAYTRRRMQS